jgi:hypothetical protein
VPYGPSPPSDVKLVLVKRGKMLNGHIPEMLCCFEHGRWAKSILYIVSNVEYHRDSPTEMYFFFHGATAPSGPQSPPFWGFTITLRQTTLGRTPLDERSARRTDLYLTTQNTHKKQTSTPPAVLELAIPASNRLQTQALGRAATGIGTELY